MGPRKIISPCSPSGKKARNTIELKKEIVKMYENGIKIAEIGRLYGKSPSTISSIVARKEEIKDANVAKGVNMLTKQRSQAIEDVEQLLLMWINQKQAVGGFLSEAIIRQKAKLLYADLIKERPETCDSDFKASRGWFEKFKRRSGVRNNTRRGCWVSLDKSVAEGFLSEFQGYVEENGFVFKQVSNSAETAYLGEEMKNRAFSPQETSGTAAREEDKKKEYIPLEPTIEIKEEPADYEPTPDTSTDTANEGFILPHEGTTWTPPVHVPPPPQQQAVEPQFTLSVASLAPKDPEASDGEQARKKRKIMASTVVPTTNGFEARPQSPVYSFGESSNPGSSKELRKDQFDVFGEYIAAKLRSLDRRSCTFAQKAIGDIIFAAELGKYLDEVTDCKDLKTSAN